MSLERRVVDKSITYCFDPIALTILKVVRVGEQQSKA